MRGTDDKKSGKKTVMVLFGGRSSEYEVSLESAYYVIDSLFSAGFDVVMIGITSGGKWFRYKGDYEYIRKDRWQQDKKYLTPAVFFPWHDEGGIAEITETGLEIIKTDVVFPVLHGKNGEDGTVQGMLSLAGVKTIGCDTLSSALCMDKAKAHMLVRAAGIDVAESVTFSRYNMIEAMETIKKKLEFPLYVKPVRAGSSVGITRVEEAEELMAAVENAFEHDDEVTIEEEVCGCEVGCAIIGDEKLVVGRVDEIDTGGVFFGYNEKYTQKNSKIYMPARISSEKEKEIQAVGVKIYRALGCRGFARVDMFLTPQGRILFNEVNTIPGMTAHSRFPNMLKGIGMTFDDTIRLLCE